MSAWIFIGGLLNFLSCLWVLRKMKFSPLAASAGAFIFASSLPTLSAPDHAQLIYRFSIPLAFYYFWLFINTGDIRKLGWLSLWTLEQFLCSIYLGVFLIYTLFFFGLAYVPFKYANFIKNFIKNWECLSLKQKIQTLFLVIFSLSILGLLLWKYHQISSQYELHWSKQEIEANFPTLKTYFWFGPSFIGFGLLALLLIAIIVLLFKKKPYRYRKLGIASCISFIAVLLVVVKFGNFSFYYLFLSIPGISALRGMYRVIYPDLILAAILIAILLESVRLQFPCIKNKWLLVFSIIIALIICSETLISPQLTYRSSHKAWQERIAQLLKLFPVLPTKNNFLNIKQNFLTENALTELDAMILSQNLEVPTLNGFSGHSTPGYLHNPCFSLEDKINAFLNFSPKSIELASSIRNNVIEVDATELIRQGNIERTISIGEVINFSKTALNKNIYWPALSCGWSTPEEWGTWSDGPKAKIFLPLPKDKAHFLQLKLRALVNQTHPFQSFTVQINNNKPLAYRLTTSEIQFINLALTQNDTSKGLIEISFKFFNPIAPRDIGIGNDQRSLGIGLYSIAFK